MKELTLPATLENISEVIAFIDAELEAVDCGIKAQTQIDVAVDELFGNIVHYAYAPDTGEATVRFDFDEETRTARIDLIDSGIPFDPLAQADPDVTSSAEERKIGGLGIFLAKKTMDNLRYERVDGRNILHIQKKI